MTCGLLDALTDPALRAQVEQRNYLVSKIAEQMGISRGEALEMLLYFEEITTSEGQTIH